MGVCSSRPEDQCVRLLAEYKLGSVLGQGSFGIVYSCKAKDTGREYAVKMIDKAESPYEDIQREVEMLERLAHPNVVALHDTFYEKVFVCLVMDIYRGGDLINGMQSHWRDVGDIPHAVVARLSEQMLLSVAWLHSQNVVHRDVKGDNYMLDRADIGHPSCTVFLSDFGTVCDATPTQRFSAATGTTKYWSPEFYRKDYGHKVDVWAVGVVSYGLLNRTFPFKDENAVKNKEISFKVRCSALCQRFVRSTLRKDEEKRLSSADAVKHAWLQEAKAGTQYEAESGESTEAEDSAAPLPWNADDGPAYHREQPPNYGVVQRRLELVERLENLESRTHLAKISTNNFEVRMPQSARNVRYEWWAPQQAQAAGILNFSGAEIAPNADDGRVGMQVINRTLIEQGVDVRRFGQGAARSLVEFVDEVRTGESRLMMDASNYRRIVRVVDLVLLRLSSGEGPRRRYLVKASETYVDGRERKNVYVLPGMKTEPHENVQATSRRILLDRLGLSDYPFELSFDDVEYFEEEVDSPSYPGVRTVYHKTIIAGKLGAASSSQLSTLGLSNGKQRGSYRWSYRDATGCFRTYEWLTKEQCAARDVRLVKPTVTLDVSPLVHPPISMPEEELARYLRENRVDAQHFPGMDAFTSELLMGEAAFAQQPTGRLIRVVELVVVVICNPRTGALLVEAEESVHGRRKALRRLPATKRRADENHFLAARRVLATVLRVNEMSVSLRPTDVKMIQEVRQSKNYAGLPTVYNKRIVYGNVVEP